MAIGDDGRFAAGRERPTSSSSEGDALSNLLALLRALRTRWWVALLIAVPMVAAAWWYVEELPSEYTSEAIVLVEPRPEAGTATGTSVVRLKAPSYVSYVTAPAITRRLDDQLALDTGTVDSVLDAQVQSETGNVVITATSRFPDRAEAVAAAAAAELVDFSERDQLLQAQVLAPPVLPDEPSGPPRTMIQAGALLVAVLLGSVVAIAVARRRPRIEEAGDVEALTNYELLGRVPRRRRLPAGPGLAIADPVVGTAVRSLRVRLSADVPTWGTVTVTSAVSGEGKSTIAALLATAFARTGVEVCLLDGDLRRPTLARHVEDWDGIGLDKLLHGDAVVSEALVSGWGENLTVLPTAADADAGELLAERLPAILRELQSRFELVVIDGPNVLGSDEARVLASSGNKVVFVVGHGSDQEAVHDSYVILSGLRADVAGFVLNRSVGGRGYRSYDYET